MKRFTQTLLAAWIALILSTLAVADDSKNTLMLASTTSTNDSGLFEYLLPKFSEKTHIDVRTIINGTGQALRTAQDCNADVLLVHDKKSELEFMDKGFGDNRREIMYNDFVIVGPSDNPAHIDIEKSVHDALKQIASSQSPFISRGDDSGTHKAELRLWKATHIDPKTDAADNKWYREAGAGMGAVLNMAASTNAYTLSDRATWLAFKNPQKLTIVYAGDPPLFNQYSVISVNQAKCPNVNHDAAMAFSNWLSSKEGQQIIGDFKINGTTIFKPNYSEGNK